MQFDEDLIGVLWVDGLESDGVDQQALLDVLWRIGREAALLWNSAEVDADLEAGNIDISQLLNIEE